MHAGVLGATIVRVEKYANLTGGFGATAGCNYNGNAMPQVLCDSKYMYPFPGTTTLIASKVAGEESRKFLSLPV